MSSSRPRVDLQIARRRLQDLQQAKRAVKRTLDAEHRRLRYQRQQIKQPLSASVHLVCRFLARCDTAPQRLIATYLLQHNPRQFLTVSAQQRTEAALNFASVFLESLTWPDPCVDAPPALRSRSWQVAFERAQRHRQEFGAAAWTARMNLENHIAPATCQVLEQWTAASSIVPDSSIRNPLPNLSPRARRRRVQTWKRRWGFRWGKMVIRDVFGESELYTKAAMPPKSQTLFPLLQR